jgi:nucleotide-binding universal stress UspA family protein
LYKKILLPTDGSELAENAVVEGIKMAKDSDAKVVGLCVIPTAGKGEYWLEVMEERVKERWEKFLEFIETKAKENKVPVKTVMKKGFPPEVIVKTAGEEGCDLIVMGSCGATGAKAVLGSVAQRVLMSSKIPVLMLCKR